MNKGRKEGWNAGDYPKTGVDIEGSPDEKTSPRRMRETSLSIRRTAQLNEQRAGHGGGVDTGCVPSSDSKPFQRQRQRQQQRWRRPFSAPISRAPPPSRVNPPLPRSDTKQEGFGVSYAVLGEARGVGHSVSAADVRAGPTGTRGGRRLTGEERGRGGGGGRTEGVWRRRRDEERWRRNPDGEGGGVGGRGFQCLQSRLAEVRGGRGAGSEGWVPEGLIGSVRARRTQKTRCRVLDEACFLWPLFRGAILIRTLDGPKMYMYPPTLTRRVRF